MRAALAVLVARRRHHLLRPLEFQHRRLLHGQRRADGPVVPVAPAVPQAAADGERHRGGEDTSVHAQVGGAHHEQGRGGAAPDGSSRHDAPLLVMTAGGYTGNLFHAFSDGFVPAWLTVQHLRRRVVLGVLLYNPWWAGTYGEIISGLLDYHVVDLLHDKRKHCFPGAIIGTRFHGILSVNPARLRDNKTIVDFHDLLADVYETAGDTVVVDVPQPAPRRPRLGIVSCRGKRVIENQAAVARLARTVGFDVDILETADGLQLPASYASVSACDVLVGVHSADLTKLLFLRPGAALV
uniref:Glycosyltransferase, putative n=1 Tax=Oryza sativa subsp. japonica TaxID=39947 RepID=Q2R280_ORYSJ|nr:glycosyltransferase, putative [Oryza sativa Japonica Group]